MKTTGTNYQTNMHLHVKVCFRAMLVVVPVAGIILFSTMRRNSSWKFASLNFYGNWSFITHQHVDNYWTIPSGGSLLPLENSSIDLYVDLDKLRKQVRQQNQQCKDLKEDPFTMFKSLPSSTKKFTAEIDKKRLRIAFMCGGELYPEFLTALPSEKLYPFEAFYLSDPPLWDESTVASHTHSTISLHGANKTYVVGDAVSLVIKMFDKKGRPRLKGGDRLKVWLKDEKFPHSISANITDFNNGTYLATTVLPWAGTVRVMATLRQSREFFRALAYVQRAMKSTVPFGGAYNNSQASEAVPCNSMPLVPGYQKSELCNLTVENGYPWFCGRPSKRELNCSDYGLFTHWWMIDNMPVTPAEDKLLKQLPRQRDYLKGTIILHVEATKSGLTRMQDSNVPCNKVSPRSTWHQSEPNGYFYHKEWKTFLCFLPDNPGKIDESCLKNVHMIFYGDSNARMFYENIQSKIKCNETVASTDPQLSRAKRICKNERDNVTLQLAYHSNPFTIALEKLYSTFFISSPRKLFDIVPSEGRYILHFNHYLHFTAHHISVYEKSLIVVREELIRLLKRNSNGLILFRGPHVAERDPVVYYMGDSWAQYFITLQKETFRDLQDRIIYFPTWDLTVASEDTDVHPASNNRIFDSMIQFLCGRDQ